MTPFPHLLPRTVLHLFTSELLGPLSPNTMPSFYMGAGYSNPGPRVCRACVLIHWTISPALLCTIHYKWWFAFENLFFQFSVKGYFHCVCHFRRMVLSAFVALWLVWLKWEALCHYLLMHLFSLADFKVIALFLVLYNVIMWRLDVVFCVYLVFCSVIFWTCGLGVYFSVWQFF